MKNTTSVFGERIVTRGRLLLAQQQKQQEEKEEYSQMMTTFHLSPTIMQKEFKRMIKLEKTTTNRYNIRT